MRPGDDIYRLIVETAEEGVWLIDASARTTFVNPKMASILGYTVEEMLARDLTSFIDADQEPTALANLTRRRQGIREQHDFPLRHKDGRRVWTTMATSAVHDADGRFVGALAMVRDISLRRRNELLLATQRRLFELLVGGAALSEALEVLVLSIEELVDDMSASVVLIEDGKRLKTGAAPHLPPAFNAAIDGTEIGPMAGACGTSAYFKTLVVTEDIATDPRWDAYRQFALPFGLRACWSSPILARDGRVLGTFAMYFREVRSPTPFELQTVADATAAASLAIQYVQTQQSLAHSVSILNATIESTADGILVVELNGAVRSYNRRFAELWRLPEDVLASRDIARIHAAVRDQLLRPDEFMAQVAHLQAEPAAVSHDVLEFKDGRVFERYSQPHMLEGTCVGRVWSFRDVTAQRRGAVALHESDERFRHLSEASFDGIVIHEGGTILSANETLGRMLGYAPEALVGMTLPDLAAPESHAQLASTSDAGGDLGYEAMLRRLDGSTFWAEVRSRRALFEGRGVRVAAIRDITDRKRVEAERESLLARERTARLEAERASRLREDFLAIASHELRTPLTPLKMYLQLLRKSLRDSEMARSPRGDLLARALDNTDREYQRLTRLIEDLLDVSRISAGRLVLERRECDLGEIVRETVGRFDGALERAGCALALDLAPDVRGVWDAVRLEQVVTNLLTNALKYGAGKPVGSSRVDLQACKLEYSIVSPK